VDRRRDTKVKAWIANPKEPARLREVELLVYTGAVYTVVKGKTLKDLRQDGVLHDNESKADP